MLLFAAIVVRAVFIVTLDQQTTSRLQILATAGLRSTLYGNGRIAVDRQEIANIRLLSRDQGLQWFDLGGRLLGSEGLAPYSGPPIDGHEAVSAGDQRFDTFAIPVMDPKTQNRVGTIRSSELNATEAARVRGFDTGLLLSVLAAIIGSGVAGLILTRRAVRPVTQAFETLRVFTADASHELRGPLTAIASNADAALRDVGSSSSQERARFQAIADAAHQMARLTNDLLLLASADRSLERDLFVVDLRSLVERVMQQFGNRFAAKGLKVTTLVEPGATAYGNPDQIERMIGNLVENAVRYTPPGGSVEVTARRDRTHLLISVKDTGIGIAPEHAERVFDRFWRADPARSLEGTGLGLAISRALARRHGGDVKLWSRPGAGSEFVISLPTRPPNID